MYVGLLRKGANKVTALDTKAVQGIEYLGGHVRIGAGNQVLDFDTFDLGESNEGPDVDQLWQELGALERQLGRCSTEIKGLGGALWDLRGKLNDAARPDCDL